MDHSSFPATSLGIGVPQTQGYVCNADVVSIRLSLHICPTTLFRFRALMTLCAADGGHI